MEVVNAREADLTENPHQVKASRLYDTEYAQVVHITLEPGESLKKHVYACRCVLLCPGRERDHRDW
jgi:quercetin dioxygenase-like cupin family protein